MQEEQQGFDRTPPKERCWEMRDPFEAQLIALCLELETWRQESKDAADSEPNSLPPFERRAALHSLVFFVSFLVASYLWQIAQRSQSTAAILCVAVALIISSVSAPILFVFQAVGLAKAQFWRALLHIFSDPKTNFPFTPLMRRIEHDLNQQARLRCFSLHVLTTIEQRIVQDESELRERLSTFIGTPTIYVIFGVIAGSVTAWENYHAHPDSVSHSFLFWGSIGLLIIGLYGFRLRISLIEFARCRALLSLEISRRGALNVRDHSRRRPSRSRK